MRRLLGLLLVLFMPAAGRAGLNVSPLASTETADVMVLTSTLLGPGIFLNSVSFTGQAAQAGTFTGGGGIIDFSSGIVLSTGTADKITGPNTPAQPADTDWGNPGDPDIDAVVNYVNPSYDAVVLDFWFTPDYPNLSFSFIFASEEYGDPGLTGNDAFAFIVNGANVALVPGTSEPVSIHTINSSTHSNYYVPNLDGHLDTQMDGLTTELIAQAAVTPGVPNHIKIVIADVIDHGVDSVVLLKANSFAAPTSTPTRTPTSTISPTFTFTPTRTISPTRSPTPTVSATRSSTPTLSSTPSKTPSFTPTQSFSVTPTFTASPTQTITFTFSPTPTATPTHSPSFTITDTFTHSPTRTPTLTRSPTPTITETFTYSPTRTETLTRTPTPTITETFTYSPTATPTSTITRTFTPRPTFTVTRTGTVTCTFTDSPTRTDTPTWSPTRTATLTCTASPTPTATPTDTPTRTYSATYTVTRTPTHSPTITSTFTDSPTFTVSPTRVVQDSLLKIRGLFPNPFSDHCTLFYTLTEDVDLEVTIYNVAGEIVWREAKHGLKGTNLSVWQGVNDWGGRSASGIYLIRVRAAPADLNTDVKWIQVCVVR